MALWEDLFTDWGWGTTGVVGLGAVLVAPTLLPVVGGLVRPVVKGVIRGALALSATLQETVTEAGEQLSDLYAEAKHEYAQGQSPGDEGTRARRRTPPQPG
jgi:hypothetical protein